MNKKAALVVRIYKFNHFLSLAIGQELTAPLIKMGQLPITILHI